MFKKFEKQAKIVLIIKTYQGKQCENYEKIY